MEPAPPVTRVLLLGDDRALAEFDDRVRRAWAPSTWVPDDFPASWTATTAQRRVLVVVPGPHTSPLAVGRFDADVVVLATAWQRPFSASGPPRVYGRRALPRAAPVLWLGAGCRPAVEERALRGALRAHRYPDDAPAVSWDGDGSLDHLAAALAAVAPGHPTTLDLAVREVDGTWFSCRACGARLSRELARVRSHDPPRRGDAFAYNLRLFPGGGVFTFAPDALAWSTSQREPGPGPHEVALFDHVDLSETVAHVRPWGGGCCGTVPVGEPNLACACGARVGYSWTECVFYSVVALRLDRVQPRGVRTPWAPPRRSGRG